MRGFPRVEAFLVAAAVAAAAGCGGGGTKPRTCEDDSGCASGSRCVQRSCAANAPPVARITLPPEPVTYDLLTFDGSASSDADAPLDAVASYSWTFRAIDAPCSPPASASTAPQATVRFGCGGRYAVELEVADELGTTSASTRELVVSPRTAPLVEVGQDLVVEHACSGEPLVCRPEGAVALAAAVPSAAGEVFYQWTVEPPPDRPLAAARRVALQPGADVPNPTVLIETDAAAISGDWIFRVTARDAAGPLGGAAVRVTVNNRKPEIVEQVLPLPHTFDPRVRTFEASGTIRIRVDDPDGDPIAERTPMWRHLNDGGATFVGVDTGDALTVQVVVPYAAPEDALNLIGRAELERAVELHVVDVNGGDDFESWPIVIENRPPGTTTWLATDPALHSFDAASASYLAEVPLDLAWSDPDGDPLFQGGGTGDAECPTVTFTRTTLTGSSHQVVASCAAPFVTVSTLQNFAREHTVSITARDPWSAAEHPVASSFTIGNSAPVMASTAVAVPGTCTKSTTRCCEYDPEAGYCIMWATKMGAASTTVPRFFTDAEGDPLAIWVGSTSSSCAASSGGCPVTFTLPAETTCPDETLTGITVGASDGSRGASKLLYVEHTCQ